MKAESERKKAEKERKTAEDERKNLSQGKSEEGSECGRRMHAKTY